MCAENATQNIPQLIRPIGQNIWKILEKSPHRASVVHAIYNLD